MEVVFWSAVAFIAYVYAGYPALLAVWARLRRSAVSARQAHQARRVRLQPELPDQNLPRVSVIIAARNEAARLPARIDNLLASDYPLDRLEIIVASDGSTDGTADALAPYGTRVRLLTLAASGKAGALNAAICAADHPIVVFADARQRFAPDTIRRLVSHFDERNVGAVSGELVLDCERAGLTDRSTVSDGVGLYWKYEKWLRRHEAIVGSTLGVTGAVYAMRRCLWRPLPADTILDDVLAPMQAVLRGYHVTFDDQAHAFDETARDAAAELNRKTRTLAGNFQLLAREPRLLVPVLNPVWLQFVSHKVARLFVPYALLTVLATNLFLAGTSPVYALTLAAQAAFYGLACYGAATERRARPAQVATAEVYREAA